MVKNRPSNLKYKDSQMKWWIIRHVFDTMYSENRTWTPNQNVRRSDYEKMSHEDKMHNMFNVVDDEDYVEVKPRKIWNNTIRGITEDLAAWEGDMKLIGPKTNTDNVRNVLKELESENLLVRRGAAHNQYAYYPREDLIGFEGFIGYFLGKTKNDSSPNPYRDEFTGPKTWIPFHTDYYRIMMNRQLILDVLKERKVKLAIDLKDDKGNTISVTVPIVGRYRKIFEMGDVLKEYISVLKGLESFLIERDSTTTKELYDLLFDEGLINVVSEDTLDDKEL